MNAPDRMIDWTDANQRLLVAEFASLRRRLAGAPDADELAAVEVARALLPAPAAIDVLARLFGLSRFERAIVLLAAGIEMDSQIAALCADAQGHPQRAHATFGLALGALAEPHWSALAPDGALRRWHLVEVEAGTALTSARLRLDEPVLHFVAGLQVADPRLDPLLRPVEVPTLLDPAHEAICATLEPWLVAKQGERALVQLWGDDADGREDVAACCADRLGRCLVALDAAGLPGEAVEEANVIGLWEREALLRHAALFVDCADAPPAPPLLRFVERVGGLLFVGAERPVAVRRSGWTQPVMRPPAERQRTLWQRALGDSAARFGDEINAVAGQFRLSARRIGATAAALDVAGAPAGTLWEACRAAVPDQLAGLAQRIDARASWDDLVLPDAQKQTLAQIAVHMRCRGRVHESWGFAAKGSRGLGITALFAGDSGTGKTLAAEVLANHLKLDLFRIDLSAVVSKYIGETEKNLRRVFDAAEDCGAMLLFDEADALFGKRSDVKDSHDRYANIEVSYLLQRMECYRGLAVLTSNHKAALDSAFMRRLRFIVHFPFPEARERAAMWRRAFPPDTPTDALDADKLARLHATGGQIRNIAVHAAFRAADADEPVRMAHVLRAARADAAKRDAVLSDAETRGWL